MRRSDGFDGPVTLSLGEKLLRFNWLLAALLACAASIGALMLFSVAGGDLDPWSRRQIVRFGVGFAAMVAVALVHIRIWRLLTPAIYLGCLAMLLAVEAMGSVGMGAQRWLDLGVIRVQPSEFMKIGLVLALASYYQWIGPERASHPLWLVAPIALTLAPAALVVAQPDLGTAVFLIAIGALVMFLAGVGWGWFAAGAAMAASAVAAVFVSRGTDWQLLQDYQYRRIETFFDPSSDPLGSGYHITQSTIAIGSGGLDGAGFMQGSQTHLRFLPEAHTDFIFTTFAEEFGFRGSVALLILFTMIVLLTMMSAAASRSIFGRLVAAGVGCVFFLFFAINIAMVAGLAPVVGVPLPLVSYGGSSMLVLLFGFGLAMSARIHSEDDLRG